MRINADFSKTAIVVQSENDWIRSPESGVDRLMLDRIGDEVARATSIVRYAPGSSFPSHRHAKGEEFFVLEGVFSDESGDYPEGTYVRNPPGSSHAPYSQQGCRILVKLRQFDAADLAHVVIDTNDEDLWDRDDNGVSILPLHQFNSERVAMHRIGEGQEVTLGDARGGVEVLVVRGEIVVGEQTLAPESWLRLPDGQRSAITANRPSCLWVKSGHLAGL